MAKQIQNLELVEEIIVGRVEPHIYAFTTSAIPEFLKVGDTYRPVSVRLAEWRKVYPDLIEVLRQSAAIDDDVYFRDLSVHKFLERDLGKHRLTSDEARELGSYFSREFFQDTSQSDVEAALHDVATEFTSEPPRYVYYDANNRLPETHQYKRGTDWKLRPNQQDAVDSFERAIKSGRNNLLMYAVMRFGKSFTSLSCAKAMDAKLVVVVSAKADVRDEWKKTTEIPRNFSDYEFLDAESLLDEGAIADVRAENKTAVIFLTLQDLQGQDIKEKHRDLLGRKIDLLIVDETHFGARAEQYGVALQQRAPKSSDDKYLKRERKSDEEYSLDDVDDLEKELDARVRLHLSGTPYRILMGDEFTEEDVIAFVQFSDIVSEQQEWNDKHLGGGASSQSDQDFEEWDNPYFGFPQMIRFAFHPNESSRAKMKELADSGVSHKLTALFEPKSIAKDEDGLHKQFKHESEVRGLLRAIDGSEEDESVFGFLNYDKIREGDMCRHMVMVLPYRASCDAMESLLEAHKEEFERLKEYKILNISGVDDPNQFPKPEHVKNAISKAESAGDKTITLTVSRMLTGSTVEQWDTMLFLRDSSSPQEYDQAVFRLQSQYVRELYNSDGLDEEVELTEEERKKRTIREVLKPQTLLVDFDPDRMFRMQEQKALIYNANTAKSGNAELSERIQAELRISPIITMNKDKIKEIEPSDILAAVAEYNSSRSIEDETRDIPIDIGLLQKEDILAFIRRQPEIGSRAGLEIPPAEGEGDDIDPGVDSGEGSVDPDPKPPVTPGGDESDELTTLQKKLQTYYQRVLFFALLSSHKVTSLAEVIDAIEDGGEQRLAGNLGLDLEDLRKIHKAFDPFKLSSFDYKIQNISQLAHDENHTPLERAQKAMGKFSRISESEVRTPDWLCGEMVDQIPGEKLRDSVESGEVILDIASKSGEFALAAYQRLTGDLGLDHEQVRNAIYSIPTSSFAYEFTRKFYEILGLNVDTIAGVEQSQEVRKLIDVSRGFDASMVARYIRSLFDMSQTARPTENCKEVEAVEFSAVIGNPPYQKKDGGAGASALPIYQNFVDAALALNPRFASLVIPSRWYTGGKGLDQFRASMLANKRVASINDFVNPESVFEDTNNRGGVCYFLIDREHDAQTGGGTRVVSRAGQDVASTVTRPLNTANLGVFIRDSLAVAILGKVTQKDSFVSLETWISSRKPFGLVGKDAQSGKFISPADEFSDPVPCFAKGKTLGLVERDCVLTHMEWVDRWKVFIPRANNIGTELKDDNQNVFVGRPSEVCTETYLVGGGDSKLSKASAENLALYLQTKFARFMHSLMKASHDATRQTYRLVPAPDLTTASQINWRESVDDIDEQLFDYYGLTRDERTHIRASIQDM